MAAVTREIEEKNDIIT